MSEKKKNCLNCRINWDREGRCEVCRWEDKDHPSLFYQITRSPEELAPKLVYVIQRLATIPSTSRENPGGYKVETQWFSTILFDAFDSEAEAITATLERLKELEVRGE